MYMQYTTKDLIEALKNHDTLSFINDYIDESETLISEYKLYRLVETAISEQEVIYSTSAIEYLQENDPSLNNSLTEAHDRGYTLETLNIQTLATILLHSNLHEDWNNFLNSY